MGIGRKKGPGGGGTSLNFSVKAFSSEADLSATTPKENTIGIITTTPITNWIFSAEEPEPVADGMVWFPTSTSSTVEFNALKKNTIQVYPTSAKQYVSGSWVNKEAHMGRNGEWLKFSDEIFYIFSAERGINKGTWNKKVPGTGAFTVDANKIYISNKEDNTSYAVVVVNTEPIDTTGKSKLIVSMSVSGNLSSTSAFGLTNNATNTTYNSAMVATKKLANGDLELELTMEPGVYYFKAWINSTGSSYTATCSITEIKVV